jgi:hypothetical protein
MYYLIKKMSLFYKFKFSIINKSFKTIIKLYDLIFDNIDKNIQKFSIDGINFNNFKGDITKDIVWTWIINKEGLKLFTKFLQDIDLVNNLNQIYNNDFHILGISFITVNKKEVLDVESEYHYDILSQYDTVSKTNILTVLIPLKIEDGMGGLEYYLNNILYKCKYNIGEYYSFDSSKVKHRTQPFKLDHPKIRVLISINLSSNQKWAIEAAKKCTYYQGNCLEISKF